MQILKYRPYLRILNSTDTKIPTMVLRFRPIRFIEMDKVLAGLPLDVWKIIANFMQEPSLIVGKWMLPLSYLVSHFVVKEIKQFLSTMVARGAQL